MPYVKSLRVLLVTTFVYALLVATHLGEFWPFSIYPMFSNAGRSWSRAVVREIAPDAVLPWRPVSIDSLPGRALPLAPRRLSAIDLANFVAETDVWDDARVSNVRSMFKGHLQSRGLAIYRVRGQLAGSDVMVTFVPVIVITEDTTLTNPHPTTPSPSRAP